MTSTPSEPGSNSNPKAGLPIVKLAAIAVVVVGVAAGGYYFVSERSESPQVAVAAALPDFQQTKTKAEAGDVEAQNLLGEIYGEGKQVKRDYKEAVKWYLKAAEKGSLKAQFHLGSLYDIGQGVPHDEKEAANWYRKAAEAGLADAQYTLAAMYGLGRGVPYNPKEALAWYQKAALQGDPLALYNLAERYERARDVDEDLVEAYKFHRLAAERGLKDGEVGAANLKKKLSADQLAEAGRRIEAFKKLMGEKTAAKSPPR